MMFCKIRTHYLLKGFGTDNSAQTKSVFLEWKLQDLRGETIWVDTIVGEGTGPMGQPLNDDSGKEQVEQLLDELFLKSYEALTSSPEIQQFSSTS